MLTILWHVFKHGHSVRVNRTTTLPGDRFAKGWVYHCECRRVAVK